MIYLKVLALIILIASVFWFIDTPGWEPGIAIGTSVLALIGLFVGGRGNKKKTNTQQSQAVSKSSVGIQAGGDVNFNSKGDKNV